MKETDPFEYLDFYAATKYTSEIFLHQYQNSVPTIILRLFTPYGPGQQHRLIPELIRKIKSNQQVILYNKGSPRLNPIYITDLVTVFRKIFKIKGNLLLNVAGEETYSIKDMAEIIGNLLSKKVRNRYLIDPGKRDLVLSS